MRRHAVSYVGQFAEDIRADLWGKVNDWIGELGPLLRPTRGDEAKGWGQAAREVSGCRERASTKDLVWALGIRMERAVWEGLDLTGEACQKRKGPG